MGPPRAPRFEGNALTADWFPAPVAFFEFLLAAARLRPSAWQSDPAALVRLLGWPAGPKLAARAWAGGRGRTRTYEGVSQRIYSPPPLPLGTLSRTMGRRRNRASRSERAIWLGHKD